jgi:3-methyladenine DNA glycosylase AlkD
MDTPDSIHRQLVDALEAAGSRSLYLADANETDPRYRSYGVRMPEVRAIWRSVRPMVKALDDDQRLDLTTLLIESGYGEQQTLANLVLEQMADRLDVEHLSIVDEYVHLLHGWSKVDTFATGIIRRLLDRYPDELVELARAWSSDPDPWLRRMSVVIFTRRVAESGRFTAVALELCDNLAEDPHPHVRTGVAWARKDLAKAARSANRER